MTRSGVILLLLLCSLLISPCPSLQASAPNAKTYWAAVVEFHSEPYNQPSETRVENAVAAYVDLIESVDAAAADIIVFPESTLNSIHQAFVIPEPNDNVAPCDDVSGSSFHSGLRNISCSARDTKKYVVINVTEKKIQKKEDDKEEVLHYNANVVFNRNGVVISRYRKFNLFGEAGINVTATPDISFFTTDFGVTFGHFICFDMLFKTPALKLIEKGITDIVYPTMWFSELPFLTAVQSQEMWAKKQQVNFLAAGASNPDVGSTGTGIYSRDGAIVAVMSGTPLRKVYLAEVIKKQFWNEVALKEQLDKIEDTHTEDIKMKRDHLDVYNAKHLNFSDSQKIDEELCYHKLCCDFEIEVSKRFIAREDSRSYEHFMVVFDGVRTYDGFATGGTFTCAMISCLNNSLASCGLRFDKNETVDQRWTFDSIKISGKFRYTEDTMALPNTVDSKLMPLPPSTYKFEEEAAKQMIHLTLTEKTSDIYTFGIYGRDFAKDGQEPSSANRLLINLLFTLMLSVLVMNFWV